MQGHEVNEPDWKLFRKRLPEWQERYAERLIGSYIEALTSDTPAMDRFWLLGKRIRQDQQRTGIQLPFRMSRSNMENNLLSLLQNHVIEIDDLEGFSEELHDQFRYITERLGDQ